MARQRPIKPMPDDVILLAMGEGRKLCPFDAETWSVNRGYRQVAQMNGHVERLFCAHDSRVRYGDKTKVFDWDEMNLLADAGVEIWNTHKLKQLNSRLYPLKRLIKKFNTEFFGNTLCYMMVFAIDQWTKIKDGKVVLKDDRPKRIRWYGADMTTMGEYQLEKGSMEYWIGYARGLGITVETGPISCLCTTPTGRPYGQTYYSLKQIDPFGLLKNKFPKRKSIAPIEISDDEMAQHNINTMATRIVKAVADKQNEE